MYKDLTDEKIIELYRQGDDLALDFLLDKYKYLASKISRSYFLIGAENEDLLQEAMIGLYSACRKYNESMGTTFKTFATLCINRAIQSAVKIANRQKNKIFNESYSLSSQGTIQKDEQSLDEDELVLYIPSNEPQPEDVLMSSETIEEIFKEIDEKLSKKEKKVLMLYLNGLSYLEISNILKENTKSVDNAISRTKKKLSNISLDLQQKKRLK